jgi:purine-nucleoside phosphorylase
MINIIGADVVGMSSIPEVIVGKYYGMDVCMLSVVSNVCYPKDRIKFTTVESVIQVMNAKAQDLGKILNETLAL